MCRFISGNWFFFCTKFVQIAVAGKSHGKRRTFTEECNKLDLTAVQYFWSVDHNDWSKWFAISSSHLYAVQITVLVVGLQKKKKS